MKKFAVYIILISVLLSCNNKPTGSEKYLIKGIIKAYPGNYIKLVLYEKGELNTIDSTQIIAGEFIFKTSKIEHPKLCYLIFGENDVIIDFFLENSEIIINVDIENYAKAEIIGSETQKEYASFTENILIYENKQQGVSAQTELAIENNDTILLNQLDSVQTAVDKEQTDFIKQFVEEHSQSYVAAYLASECLPDIIHTKDLTVICENFKSPVSESVYILNLKHILKIRSNLVTGKQAPNFTLPDINGKDVSLASLQGKFAVLIFWASWNNTSVKKNIDLYDIYEKYNKKGFEILSVSLDEKKENWENCVNKNKLKGIQVSDSKGIMSDLAKLFDIKQIPTVFFLDRKGKVIFKNPEGSMLDIYLSKELN